jgi:hypothetical protein
MVLVNLALHIWKNFSENYQQFEYAHSETSTSPSVDWESLRSSGGKGRQILAYPGRPRVSGRGRVKILYISFIWSCVTCEKLIMVMLFGALYNSLSQTHL